MVELGVVGEARESGDREGERKGEKGERNRERPCVGGKQHRRVNMCTHTVLCECM